MGSSYQFAMDGMSFGRLQVLFPFQRCARSGKQLSLTAAGVLWRRSDVASVHPPFICVVFQHLLVRYRATIAAGRDHTHHGGRCGDVERWQPHSEACTLCLSLNRGGRPPKTPKKRKKKHHQLVSPCPKPFQQLSYVQVRLQRCLQSPATADKVDLFRKTQRYAITWGKQSDDDAKTLVL